MPHSMIADCSKVDVSILVVSYNTKELTLGALASVYAETRDVSFEVIVVDNASQDGSVEAIRSEFPEIKLIALTKNLGFAAANNLASAHANGRYILLLNPDTIVLEQAIDRLVAFARRKPGAKIWGGRTVFGDMRLNPSSCWARMTVWNLFCRASGLTAVFHRSEVFNGECYGEWAHDSVRNVDIVSGCFLLIEHPLWTKLGGFAPLFFMYGEEADLCLRAQSVGARPIVTPEASIVHLGGASEGLRTDKMIKLLAAKATLIERHFSSVSRPVARFLLMLWPASRALSLWVMARATGSARLRSSGEIWLSVWRARNVWCNGYPAALGRLPIGTHGALAGRARPRAV